MLIFAGDSVQVTEVTIRRVPFTVSSLPFRVRPGATDSLFRVPEELILESRLKKCPIFEKCPILESFALWSEITRTFDFCVGECCLVRE